MTSYPSLVIGVDFGTDSVRAVLVDATDGQTLGSKVHWYERWKQGRYCSPQINQFRQHPSDHIDGLTDSITQVISTSGVDPGTIKGICIDTTGSSPLPVNSQGVALALTNEFRENPNAMMVLWKDHTALKEAEEINDLAHSWGGVDYTQFVGGIYSSEWFWAKILHIIRKDASIKEAAHTWMEHCDYMTYILTGSPELSTFKRSRCAAGHKAMWHQSWGGLPSEDFLGKLDPYLGGLKSRLYEETYTSDQAAGALSSHWAHKLGLNTNTSIAVGTFDAHAGAVGAEVAPGTLVRVMGTSTCDIIVSEPQLLGDHLVKGICGQVDGSVIPGMIGLEAGQSAFGDLLAWFYDILCWPLDHVTSENQKTASQQFVREVKENLMTCLSESAARLPIDRSVPIALDWINGRRTPDADQNLKAAISGLSLGTKAPEIFRSLVEAICFGSKKIVDRFREEGIEIKSVVGIGGVAKKSPFIMQTLADVLNIPIKVATSDQASALGAAMYAATSAALYPSVEQAIEAMGNGLETTYYPQPQNINKYRDKYEQYLRLGQFVASHHRNP